MPPAANAQTPGPAPSVTYATVAVQNVTPAQSYIGHVVAIQTVNVVPRVTALINDVAVKQGSVVKTGDVLFQLDKSQYQAAVQSAQAQVASAQANAKQAEAAYQMAAQLGTQGYEAQMDLNTALATRDQDNASVLVAQANLTQANLNLAYCTITSPIDGQIGAVTMTKGNLVTPSTAPLATIVQLDPIRVVFAISDSTVVTTQQASGTAGRQIVGTAVNLTLPDGSSYGQTGKIAFFSNQVDTLTGTLSVYADFANPNRLLLPGAYVTVSVHRAKPLNRPVVPVAAIQTDQTGSYVLLIGPDNKVIQRPLQLGQQIGEDFIVTQGLSGGERVVVAGLQKVTPGQTVQATPEPPPPAPAPAISTSSAPAATPRSGE
ncbi:MAG TPA: efflux RND transporter periplasmic adaptor subunit [Devosiaceae bacterium]|jgi:membrane fusion protein (multidrug efflux system)|nr:efflux RND transporter periplasmic adaptor subunit [Devosiaceae bacterium]